MSVGSVLNYYNNLPTFSLFIFNNLYKYGYLTSIVLYCISLKNVILAKSLFFLFVYLSNPHFRSIVVLVYYSDTPYISADAFTCAIYEKNSCLRIAISKLQIRLYSDYANDILNDSKCVWYKPTRKTLIGHNNRE